MNARETSAPIMPARSAEEGGRSAATSYGSIPRPATFDGFGDTGFGVTVAPDEDFRPRTPRGARSSLSAGVIGAGVLVFGLGAAVGALVSGANPLASTIAQVRRAPYPPPARYPTRPPRATSAPPRARVRAFDPGPNRPLARSDPSSWTPLFFFFSRLNSPPDSVSPDPPRSPPSLPREKPGGPRSRARARALVALRASRPRVHRRRRVRSTRRRQGDPQHRRVPRAGRRRG